jgi:activator of HSP90 ATPase
MQILVALAIAAGAIHQEAEFNASPIASAQAAHIYQALLDEKEFSALTRAPARIEPQPGGTFSLFGGRVTGRILELVPNQRIVESWRLESWPAGVYSTVRIELTPTPIGIHLTLDQTGFPEADRSTLERNWPKMYWEPLRRYLYLQIEEASKDGY